MNTAHHFKSINPSFYQSSVTSSTTSRNLEKKDKRPISSLNLIANGNDFENRNMAPFPQSTRNAAYGSHHNGQDRFFQKDKKSKRMNTFNDEPEECQPTTRLPLKIRNFAEKNSGRVEMSARGLRTEND